MAEERYPVTIGPEHVYCKITGFCIKCGSHEEMVRYSNMLCVYADNVIPISHIRNMAILDKEKAESVS